MNLLRYSLLIIIVISCLGGGCPRYEDPKSVAKFQTNFATNIHYFYSEAIKAFDEGYEEARKAREGK